MENLPAFVSGIVRLWNLNQYRSDLYQQAMTLENVGSLRRICSHGYISSLLFKKEIQWVYDGLKCSLMDGDISKNQPLREKPQGISERTDKLSLAGILRRQEQKTIRIYHKLMSAVPLSKDISEILADHLYKLKDIDIQLNKELRDSYENQHNFHHID